MFCAFELLDSSLSSSSTSILDSPAIEFYCIGVPATARLPSIYDLLLLAATVAAFIARLFLGSESSGIDMSVNSYGTANSPAVLPISSLLLTFCECLVRHLILFSGSEGIGPASTFFPNGTNSCVGFLPCNLSNGVRPSRPLWHLDKMLHVPTTTARSESLLDTTQQHHCV